MEIDLSRVPKRVQREMDNIFRKDFDLKVLKAIERQTKIAKARRGTLRNVGDLRPAFEIDPFVDSIWRQFYGHNYTENPDLMKFLAKRNEEIVMKSRPGTIRLAFTRFGGCTKRFEKRYELKAA